MFIFEIHLAHQRLPGPDIVVRDDDCLASHQCDGCHSAIVERAAAGVVNDDARQLLAGGY